jgi:hypothetical protein
VDQWNRYIDWMALGTLGTCYVVFILRSCHHERLSSFIHILCCRVGCRPVPSGHLVYWRQNLWRTFVSFLPFLTLYSGLLDSFTFKALRLYVHPSSRRWSSYSTRRTFSKFPTFLRFPPSFSAFVHANAATTHDSCRRDTEIRRRLA